MKLHNCGGSTVHLEIFEGPGQWFKAEVPAGGSVDVPAELAEHAAQAYGLTENPPASAAKKPQPKNEEK